LSTSAGSVEEYALYCSCRRFSLPSRWRNTEIRTCEVSSFVYRRGYGSPEEVMLLPDQPDD
jgi:hypothetical protein